MNKSLKASILGFSGGEVVQSCLTLCDPIDWPTRLLCPWDFPGNSTGVDCHFLLQGIFPTQGLNQGLPHCRQTLYHLSHQGSQMSLKHQPKHTEQLDTKTRSIYMLSIELISDLKTHKTESKGK